MCVKTLCFHVLQEMKDERTICTWGCTSQSGSVVRGAADPFLLLFQCINRSNDLSFKVCDQVAVEGFFCNFFGHYTMNGSTSHWNYHGQLRPDIMPFLTSRCYITGCRRKTDEKPVRDSHREITARRSSWLWVLAAFTSAVFYVLEVIFFKPSSGSYGYKTLLFIWVFSRASNTGNKCYFCNISSIIWGWKISLQMWNNEINFPWDMHWLHENIMWCVGKGGNIRWGGQKDSRHSIKSFLSAMVWQIRHADFFFF